MRIIRGDMVIKAVTDMFLDICTNVDISAREALKLAQYRETKTLSRYALSVMNKNIEIAAKEEIPACQDTGMAVIFVEVGNRTIIDCDLDEAINQGVREAYHKYMRKSVLHPLGRVNTGSNTPAVIHYELSQGEGVKISVMAKGFGSENKSKLFMLTPADGIEGIKRAVIETVRQGASSACPPLIVGVGIGGTMEKACLIAKKSLLREIGSVASDPEAALLERELLELINNTGIGAQGLSGDITALAVFIETYPTHIAGLPVAVNIQCHCQRHKSVTLYGEAYD